jgi:uncharacterized membrane protein
MLFRHELVFLSLSFILPVVPLAFAPYPQWGGQKIVSTSSGGTSSSSTALHFFDKVFEEEGPLGKGITVGKVQVALMSNSRGDDSIFGMIRRANSHGSSTNYDLACTANELCLSLLRKSDDWTAACSEYKWFKEDDSGKAESYFNDLANREAVKFEKEYILDEDSEEKPGGPTTVVVSMIMEIQGDATNFQGAGFSIQKTKEVLQSIASDVLVEDGDCVNAVEVFWTPGEPSEMLTSRDLIMDFPELVTL